MFISFIGKIDNFFKFSMVRRALNEIEHSEWRINETQFHWMNSNRYNGILSRNSCQTLLLSHDLWPRGCLWFSSRWKTTNAFVDPSNLEYTYLMTFIWIISHQILIDWNFQPETRLLKITFVQPPRRGVWFNAYLIKLIYFTQNMCWINWKVWRMW